MFQLMFGITRPTRAFTFLIATSCITWEAAALQQAEQDSLSNELSGAQVSSNDMSSVQLRGGVLTLFSRRNAKLAGRVGKGSGVHPGAEVSIWLPRAWGSDGNDGANSVLGITSLGLYGRMLGGTFSADSTAETPGNEAVGEINNADIEVYAGRPVLHARVGYGLRSFTGALGTTRWSFVRLGARSTFSLGTSQEFEVSLGAAFYVGVSGDRGGSGREGETRLTFIPQCDTGTSVTSWICRRVTAIVAYRFEQFTARAASTSGGNRPEEVSSLIVGIGIRP